MMVMGAWEELQQNGERETVPVGAMATTNHGMEVSEKAAPEKTDGEFRSANLGITRP